MHSNLFLHKLFCSFNLFSLHVFSPVQNYNVWETIEHAKKVNFIFMDYSLGIPPLQGSIPNAKPSECALINPSICERYTLCSWTTIWECVRTSPHPTGANSPSPNRCPHNAIKCPASPKERRFQCPLISNRAAWGSFG